MNENHQFHRHIGAAVAQAGVSMSPRERELLEAACTPGRVDVLDLLGRMA